MTSAELLAQLNLKITPFSAADQNSTTTFCTAIFEEMGWKVSYLDGIDNIPAYFHFPKGIFLVVKDREEVAGCAGIKPLSDTVGLVKRFYVAQQLRGTGVAAKLLEELIVVAKQHGFTELVLDVYFLNPRAAAFYSKHGFQQYSPVPNDDWSESTQPELFKYYRLALN